MDENEREQASLKEVYQFKMSFHTIFINAILVLFCIVCFAKTIQYLGMNPRTKKDEEQMIMCAVMSFVWPMMMIFINVWFPMLMTKLLDKTGEKEYNTNVKVRKKIPDVFCALRKIKHSQGLIVWDTLWGSLSGFMIAVYIFNYQRCKPIVLGIILFLLVMLFGGHIIGKNLGKFLHYDKRLCHYTKQYIKIPDEKAYIEKVDHSIKKGVIAFTGYWLLTDDYMIGRLSDITYEPVAIPRSAIAQITFFLVRTMDNMGLPIGTLHLQLKNGREVELCIGRLNVCDQTLCVLKEQGIVWREEEMQYRY